MNIDGKEFDCLPESGQSIKRSWEWEQTHNDTLCDRQPLSGLLKMVHIEFVLSHLDGCAPTHSAESDAATLKC